MADASMIYAASAWGLEFVGVRSPDLSSGCAFVAHVASGSMWL